MVRYAQLLGIALVLFQACTSRRSGAPVPLDTRRTKTDVRVADCEGPALSLASGIRSTLKPRTGRMNPDDHWADLAEQVPGGFAGVLYVDDKPTLMLTHPERAAETKRALAA